MFKRGITGLILRFFGALLNFSLTVILAKNMVKGDFGSYQLVITLIVGMSLLARVGMDTFLLSTIPGESIKRKINFLFQQSLFLVFQCSIILLISLAALYYFYHYLIENGIDLGFEVKFKQNILVFIAILPQSIFLLISAFEKASDKTNNALFLSSVGLPLVMLGILLTGNNFNLDHVSYMYLISSAMVMLIAFIITATKIECFNSHHFKSSYSFFYLKKGLKYLPHSVITYAILWLDILVIGAVLEGDWTADYSVASRVTLIILLAMSVYDALVSPQIIKSYKQNTIDIFIADINSYFYKTALFISFFVIIMVFLSKYIIALFGDQYATALSCAYILIAAYGVKSFASLPGYALIAMNKIHIVNRILMGAVVLNLGINLLLINDYKIIGVAVGTLITSIYIVIFSYIGMFQGFKKLKNKNAL